MECSMPCRNGVFVKLSDRCFEKMAFPVYIHDNHEVEFPSFICEEIFLCVCCASLLKFKRLHSSACIQYKRAYSYVLTTTSTFNPANIGSCKEGIQLRPSWWLPTFQVVVVGAQVTIEWSRRARVLINRLVPMCPWIKHQHIPETCVASVSILFP